MSNSLALGVDLGGTKILGLIVDQQGKIHGEQSLPTPIGSADFLLDALSTVVKKLTQQCAEEKLGTILGLGVGAPGPLNPKDGLIYTMPNLPGMENYPLAKELTQRTGLETRLENDANAALLGEVYFGAAKGHSDAVMLTLGTGVGGAVFAAGQMVHGDRGSAGELGHITVEWDSPRRCGCGRLGCLETVASGTAVSAILKESTLQGESGRDFLDLLVAKDPGANKILDRVVQGLSRACSCFINTLNPKSIVIGGGFGSALFEYLHRPLSEALKKQCFEIAYRDLQIHPAKLGNLAGAMGAASPFLSIA
ncbi:MAG: ROK family protein [Planctomycetota bacterium]|nr:ROK family protein [Planctomycetota bacterium]